MQIKISKLRVTLKNEDCHVMGWHGDSRVFINIIMLSGISIWFYPMSHPPYANVRCLSGPIDNFVFFPFTFPSTSVSLAGVWGLPYFSIFVHLAVAMLTCKEAWFLQWYHHLSAIGLHFSFLSFSTFLAFSFIFFIHFIVSFPV
jgi:hypothetical protein